MYQAAILMSRRMFIVFFGSLFGDNHIFEDYIKGTQWLGVEDGKRRKLTKLLLDVVLKMKFRKSSMCLFNHILTLVCNQAIRNKRKKIKYHFGGYFAFSPHRAYVNGSLLEKEYDEDLISYFDILAYLKKYCEIDPIRDDKFFYLKVNSIIRDKDGLVEILFDQNVKDMLDSYNKHTGRSMEIFTLSNKYSVEHNSCSETQYTSSNVAEQLNESDAQANGEDGGLENSSGSDKTIKRKRNTRGPTRCLKIIGLKSRQKLPIEFDEDNQAIGENSTGFIWYLGKTVRSRACCPLQVKEWKEIKNTIVEHMWNIVLEKFCFEEPEQKKEYILGHMQALYRGYRCKLKKTYYDSKSTYQLRLRNKPKHIDVNDWKYLVNLWSETTFQERSMKNKTNRAKRSMPPYTGTKSYARLRHQMEKKNGKKPSRVDVYIESRKRKNGNGVDPLAQDVIAQFEQLKKQREEGNNSLHDDDIFSKVLGPEKNGPGKSVTGYFGGRPTKLDLLKQVETTRIEANERDKRVQATLMPLLNMP
ncbi:hypothetical protein M5689_010891 [Euphorbia peplus]|nr:hypothetical protein M5689_010891 [Euphorbia peplus]